MTAAERSATPLLRITDLTIEYGDSRRLTDIFRRKAARSLIAVDGVSLDVADGEIVALVGESGSGKTSLAEGVLRTGDLQGGRIEFQGSDITHATSRALRPVRRALQFIPQDPYESLDARMRVRDLVREPLEIHDPRMPKERQLKKVRDTLARVGLEPSDDYLEKFPHQLSGGQRQRVVIATALILHPRLVVADEPVSMLDVSVRAGILELLSEIRSAEGLGILMITHDLSSVAHFADRVAVMYRGRIVEEGPARQVISDPLHPYTKALVKAVPTRERRGQRPALATPYPDEDRRPSRDEGCGFLTRCIESKNRCSETNPDLRESSCKEHLAACIHVRAEETTKGPIT